VILLWKIAPAEGKTDVVDAGEMVMKPLLHQLKMTSLFDACSEEVDAADGV